MLEKTLLFWFFRTTSSFLFHLAAKNGHFALKIIIVFLSSLLKKKSQQGQITFTSMPIKKAKKGRSEKVHDIVPMFHTVSSQNFRSLSFLVISVGDFQHCILVSEFFREIAMFSLKKISFNNFFKFFKKFRKKHFFSKNPNCFLWRQSAWKCI